MASTAVLERPVDATVEPPAPPSGGRPRWVQVVAAVVVGFLIVAFIAGVTGSDDDGDDSATSAVDEASALAPDGADFGGASTTMLGVGNASGLGSPAGATASADAAAAAPATSESKLAVAEPMVVKTGSVDLEVTEGTFASAVDAITSKVIGYGGFVADTTTSESDDDPSGTVVVRVPAASYEALLADVEALGEVQSSTSKGTEVSAQFTDLSARISALEATRQRLVVLLGETANVGELLQVQDRITGVQTEIEQYQGQRRLLEDQASLATLSITLGEPGAERVELASEGSDDGGLGQAWRDAREIFGDGLEGIVTASGVAAVLALLGAFGFAGYVAVQRIRRTRLPLDG